MSSLQLPVRKIWYDPVVRRQEFEELLSHFLGWVQSEKVRSTIGLDPYKQLYTQLNQVRARLNRDFTLMVLGDFKRGKSTLVNALLGMPVVTTDVTPETVTINEIRYGPQFQIQACLVNGGRTTLKPEELKAERLSPILTRLSSNVTHLNIEAPVEWLRQICLVDTPGMGDIEWRFDKQVQNYLPKADAVLYVISAVSPLSQTERDFLKLAISPQDFPKLFFVLNMMDVPRREEEARRLLASVKGKINQLFPNAAVFGLSALDEYCRLQSLERAEQGRAAALAQAFSEFRAHLEESILLNRDLIQLDRAFAQMEQVLRELDGQASRLQRAIEANQKQLEEAIIQCEDQNSQLHRRIAQHKQQVRYQIERFSQEASGWLNEFINRLEQEVIPTLSTAKLSDVKRHFPFFLSDSLSAAVSNCLDAHRAVIVQSVNHAKTAIFTDIRRLADVRDFSPTVAKITFAHAAWSNLDTVHFLLDSALGGIFNMAADVLMTQSKKIGEQQRMENYKANLRRSLPQLRQSVSKEMQSIYLEMANQMEQQLVNTYQQQIDASLSALRQAQQLQAAGEQKVALASHNLKDVRLLVGETYSSLKSLQQQLWPKELLTS